MIDGTAERRPPKSPLQVRARAELETIKTRYADHHYWTVKDPVSRRFFQLREEEYFILKQLDGTNSVEDIRFAFERRFAPLRLGEDQLKAYVSSLYRSGLVMADIPGQGSRLLQRQKQLRRQKLMSALTGILAIRFRGIDPERFLCWLYPKCRWIFTRCFLSGCLAVIVAAAALLVVQMDALIARLPSFEAFFTLENMLWMAVTLAVAKVLHEFGHALACKHFGGQCHELGVMLLVFTPCLYCNVSDAWMMPNKWHRIAISGAGIVVEVLLAAICTFLWWFSEPGLLNSVCLNMMFLCSVSTVLFNGNPLLRYDGYYVLSDLVEVPNLRQTAMLVVQSRLSQWIVGVNRANDRMLPGRGRLRLALYAVLAITYRIFVIVAILWFLHALLKPYGLQVGAQLISILVVTGMVLNPLWRFKRFMSQTIRDNLLKPVRTVVSIGCLAGLLAAVCFLPLPSHVTVPAWVEPHDATRVYVGAPGRLLESVRHGDSVQQGDQLAELSDAAIDKLIEQLQGQVAVLNTRLDSLRRQAVFSRSAGARLPATEEALHHTQQQLAQQQQQRARLSVTAPSSGIVLPPAERIDRQHPDELEAWSGTPLDPENVGCVVESGTTLCLLGDPSRLEAVVVIDQADIELVEVGQRAGVWLRQSPGHIVRGTVCEVSETLLDTAPRELTAYGQLPVTLDDDGQLRPAAPCYQARIQLEATPSPILLRTTGRAKIKVAPRSIAQRVYRYLASTFAFEL